LKTTPTTFYWIPVSVLAGIKLFAHLYINATSEFGLHRDEYLYLAEGDHLAWGFMEVPPMIPFFSWILKATIGVSEVSVRLLPALAGVASIYLVALMAREMGGKKVAQVIAAAGFLVSPIFLGSNNLFQPVSFNQFWWLVICYLTIKIINTPVNKYWYALGASTGLAILTKYSVAFLILALLFSLVISRHRKLVINRGMLAAIGIATVIALPNLIWQIRYELPVIRHMSQLASSQLVNMSVADFMVPQFLFQMGSALLWVSGLVFVLFNRKMSEYRFLGWTYIAVFLLVLSLDGKSYYIYGIYSTLYALGGIAWENWLNKWSYLLMGFVAISNIAIIPYALPILQPEDNVKFMAFMKEKAGVDAPLRWEDGNYYSIRQDYADMLGWQELPEKVAKIYHSLTEEEQAKTMIYGDSYGHAGVLNLWKDKYDLPVTMSLSSSFVAWAKENYEFDRMIYLDDAKQEESDFFNNIMLMDSIEHPLARDPGYIYYRTNPKIDVIKAWKEIVIQQKKEAGLIQ
jgi:hypothetical protein